MIHQMIVFLVKVVLIVSEFVNVLVDDVMVIESGEIVVLHAHLHVIVRIRYAQSNVYLAVSVLKIDRSC